jgi:glyceraldehyde 3-phosphate dehydrogenase (phosphorylating)
MLEKFGVKKAGLTTIHAYTSDQNLHDGSHPDLRRARAAAMSLVPTTTGAAKATTQVIPQLKGLFDGTAIRVPILTGSITDFTFLTEKKTTVEEVNSAFEQAANDEVLGKYLWVTKKPIVSSDVIGCEASALVDLALTQVIDGDLVKVFAWYDNEWGFTNRLIEQLLD